MQTDTSRKTETLKVQESGASRRQGTQEPVPELREATATFRFSSSRRHLKTQRLKPESNHTGHAARLESRAPPHECEAPIEAENTPAEDI
jgi:hypothetical protein